MCHLIFGGAGFIGTHLKYFLIENKIEPSSIRIFDIEKKGSSDYEMLDVRNPIEISNKQLEGAIIYNLAALHRTPGHSEEEYFETNILGAENVCNFARKNNIETIVFTSSIAPYGSSEKLKTEDSIPMPVNPYGVSKLYAESVHKLWQQEKPNTRKLIIVRPGVVFGKNEDGNFTRLYQSMKRQIFIYPDRKDTIKASVYVKDVVRILYETSQNEPAGMLMLNLSFFPAPTIETICQTMAKVTGVKPPKIIFPSWLLIKSASALYFTASLLGKKLSGIHPDRVKKLMVSTNISGQKLSTSPYRLQYSLETALENWFADCDQKGLF